MHADTWKRTEKLTAARLGGRRNGVTGTATVDVETERLAVECKARKALPRLLTDAMTSAVRKAKAGQVPLVVLHQTGQRHDQDIVCMRMRDYEAWYGAIQTEEEQTA